MAFLQFLKIYTNFNILRVTSPAIMFSLLFINKNSVSKILINPLILCRKFSQTHRVYKSSLSLQTLVEKSRVNNAETHLWTSHLIKRHNVTTYWGKNINVVNNVILYKFDQTKFFKYAHIFGIASIFVWLMGFCFSYGNIFPQLWNKLPDTFLEDNIVSLTLFMFMTAMGPLFCLFLWFLSARSVKYVILNKGGTHVTFITFHPLKSKSIITVPLDKVYCIKPRNSGRGIFTPIKINPYRFNFLLDNEGIYVNGDLFDRTVAWRKE